MNRARLHKFMMSARPVQDQTFSWAMGIAGAGAITCTAVADTQCKDVDDGRIIMCIYLVVKYHTRTSQLAAGIGPLEIAILL
jgi:hypothetical protein